jgi:hypothetical protein
MLCTQLNSHSRQPQLWQQALAGAGTNRADRSADPAGPQSQTSKPVNASGGLQARLTEAAAAIEELNEPLRILSADWLSM